MITRYICTRTRYTITSIVTTKYLIFNFNGSHGIGLSWLYVAVLYIFEDCSSGYEK